MHKIVEIIVNEACPAKVTGVQKKALRHSMKQNEGRWMQLVKEQYSGDVVQGFYRVEATFSRENWGGNSPDIDNLLKVVFDAIKKHVIEDDRNIFEVQANKVTGNNQTNIKVYSIEVT